MNTGYLGDKLQFSGVVVDPESDDIVAVLVGGQQECAVGIDGEVARRFAVCCLVSKGR